jgi:hypothetical protein
MRKEIAAPAVGRFAMINSDWIPVFTGMTK